MEKKYNAKRQIKVGDLVEVGYITTKNGWIEPAKSLGIVIKVRKLLKSVDIYMQHDGKTWKKVSFNRIKLVAE